MVEGVTKKFTQNWDASDYEVMTDTGLEDVEFLHETVPYKIYILKTDSYTLRCADTHIVFRDNYDEVYVKNLEVGDYILTENGKEQVKFLDITDDYENMYDLELNDSSNRRFYSNGILSHNTTSYCMFIAHTLCFKTHYNIILLANKLTTSKGILARVKFAFELLPKWMKPGVIEWNKESIKLTNGCSLRAFAASSDGARSEAANCLVVDEMAFIPPSIIEDLWASAYPTISSSKDSKVILVSTPLGTGNKFYELYNAGLIQENNEQALEKWTPFRIDWWDVPDRDEEWKQKQIVAFNYDMRKFNSEFGNCVQKDTQVTIRDTVTGEIKEIPIEELYNLLGICKEGINEIEISRNT